jgi:hypothetical protein
MSDLVSVICLAVCIACICRWAAAEEPRGHDEPIMVRGDEQGRIDMRLPDGGLQPAVGVHNVQVFRSCRVRPELADQDGWTYAHHPDLALWKGRLYAAWAMTPKDEDVPPYKVVYATSTDGFHWSGPADLFPRESAWASRFYFYRASNGRMLAFCASKSADGTVSEAVKTVLLVREIAADHQLGKVFTLVKPLPGQPAFFKTAADSGFVAACNEAVGNNLLLEQLRPVPRRATDEVARGPDAQDSGLVSVRQGILFLSPQGRDTGGPLQNGLCDSVGRRGQNMVKTGPATDTACRIGESLGSENGRRPFRSCLHPRPCPEQTLSADHGAGR